MQESQRVKRKPHKKNDETRCRTVVDDVRVSSAAVGVISVFAHGYSLARRIKFSKEETTSDFLCFCSQDYIQNR